MNQPTVTPCEQFIHRTRFFREDLANGQYRAWKDEEFTLDPADDYASTHPGPVPMLWRHEENMGRIAALRRDARRLYAVGETELEPDDLQALTDDHGELKWSTGTNRRAPFTLREISLTPDPAFVGLWPVRWLVPGSGRGSLPLWVKEEPDRKVKTRSEELTVHEVGFDFEPAERGEISGEIFHSGGVEQILAVNGRPIGR